MLVAVGFMVLIGFVLVILWNQLVELYNEWQSRFEVLNQLLSSQPGQVYENLVDKWPNWDLSEQEQSDLLKSIDGNTWSRLKACAEATQDAQQRFEKMQGSFPLRLMSSWGSFDYPSWQELKSS
jgi:hypothetical protein